MTESHSNASASSSSSLTSSLPDTEDDHTIASILAAEENSKFDATLGKRLSHLDSIPHTPRVNGEIPDVNDATLDHERLSERLATYGLAELQIEGDGNCQFRALADQLFRNPDYHKHVRKEIVKQLKHFRKLYESYVPMKYRSYVKKMKKSGEWGDHVTLQAAADRGKLYRHKSQNETSLSELEVWYVHWNLDSEITVVRRTGTWDGTIKKYGIMGYGAKISLVTSFRDTCYIEIIPKDKNPTRDVPTRVSRRKHWLF